MRALAPILGVFFAGVVLFGCGNDETELDSSSSKAASASLSTIAAPPASSSVTQGPTTTTAAPTTTAPTTTSPPPPTTTTTSTVPTRVAFNGRPVPDVPTDPDTASAMFTVVQDGLRRTGSGQEEWADLGHTEQLIIRTLIRNPEWEPQFLAGLSEQHRRIAELHLTARRELGLLHQGGPPPSERIPAWTIIDPVPLDDLVSYYRSAGTDNGIDWQILAGINLVETGMGRIDGVSYAGAQGPMQFLPTTWDEVSEGGDVRDPEDAIHGAARYLVRRGALEDIRDGLWGYNNSDHYVNAVLAYAELLEFDERALRGFYNWEIYVGSAEGTLWLPVGFDEAEPTSAKDYLAANPWAKTLG